MKKFACLCMVLCLMLTASPARGQSAVPSANDPYVTPAETVANKIKVIEALAKARISAVRYLGTANPHYYPEAEFALIKALREDPSEAVRMEAAMALGRSCSTNCTVAALMLAGSGSGADGNVAETSPHVKTAALHALNRCVNRLAKTTNELQSKVTPAGLGTSWSQSKQAQKVPSALSAGQIQLTAFYTEVLPRVSQRELLQEASLVLAQTAGTLPPRQRFADEQLSPQLWKVADTADRVRAGIHFDEEALAVPLRHETNGSRPALPKRGCIHASISFDPDGAGLGETRSTQTKSRLQPVPWPGGERTQRVKTSMPSINFAAIQQALHNVWQPWTQPSLPAESPQSGISPVPWPGQRQLTPPNASELGNFGTTIAPVSFSAPTGIIQR